MEEERAVRPDEKKPLGKKKEGWVGLGEGWRLVVEQEGWEGVLTSHQGDGRKEDDDEEG